MSDYSITISPSPGGFNQGGFVFPSGADSSFSRGVSGSWPSGQPAGDVSLEVESFSYSVKNQRFLPWNVIDDIVVDGVSVGPTGSGDHEYYTFSGVTGNHSISATFKPLSGVYTVTVLPFTNGSIEPFGVPTQNMSPTGIFPLQAGSSQLFEVDPCTAGEVTDVQVDGVSVGAVTGYLFSDISENHTICASFSSPD